MVLTLIASALRAVLSPSMTRPATAAPAMVLGSLCQLEPLVRLARIWEMLNALKWFEIEAETLKVLAVRLAECSG